MGSERAGVVQGGGGVIEFRYRSGEPDPERRSCRDCRFVRGAVSLWCMNHEACKARGTKIPGCVGCPFWRPMLPAEKRGWWSRLWSTEDAIEVDL